MEVMSVSYKDTTGNDNSVEHNHMFVYSHHISSVRTCVVCACACVYYQREFDAFTVLDYLSPCPWYA